MAYIVSFDNDLLDLMHPTRQEAQDFQQHFPNITILTPGELITRLNLLRLQQEQKLTTDAAEVEVPAAQVA